MKKTISIILSLILCTSVLFSGCGQEKEESPKSDIKAQDIQLKQTIANETLELSITQSVASAKGTDKDLHIELKEVKDSIYYIFRVKFKNINTTALNVFSNVASKLIIDDKYEYEIGQGPVTTDLAPLKTQEVLFYASVPTEVLNSCKNYSFIIAYNDDFTNCTIDKADHVYNLKGEIAQYGSADGVINFETFSEYIKTVAKDYPTLSVKKRGEGVDVSDGNALEFVDIDSGNSSFSIFPRMRFLYSSYSKRCLPNFEIEFSISKHAEGKFYGYAKTLEITSSNGTVSLDDNALNRRLDDTYASAHLYSTVFIFDYKSDFDKIKNVLDGENVTINVVESISGNDDVSLSFKCHEKTVEAMRSLLELNSKLVKEYE